MAADGSRLLVGANQAYVFGTNGEDNVGWCYFYNLSDGSLFQIFRGDNADDDFGLSVSVSADGTVAAVGASQADYVKVFRCTGKQYVQVGENINIDVPSDDDRPGTSFFGDAITLSADGRRLVVGAYLSNNEVTGGLDTGKAFVYSVEQDSVDIIGDFVGQAARDWFGYSVALSDDGKQVAIGAFYNNGGGRQSGHVRIYEKK